MTVPMAKWKIMDTVVPYEDNSTSSIFLQRYNGFLLITIEDWFWLFYKLTFVYGVKSSDFSINCYLPTLGEKWCNWKGILARKWNFDMDYILDSK